MGTARVRPETPPGCFAPSDLCRTSNNAADSGVWEQTAREWSIRIALAGRGAAIWRCLESIHCVGSVRAQGASGPAERTESTFTDKLAA